MARQYECWFWPSNGYHVSVLKNKGLNRGSAAAAAAAAKSIQLCPTPSDPMDCSLPGSSVHGIFQARVLDWVAIAFSETENLTGD